MGGTSVMDRSYFASTVQWSSRAAAEVAIIPSRSPLSLHAS